MNALAWMLTYLLHSTLLLGLAWLVSKPLSRWSVSAEEAVWKLALVGALFTASIQLAAGWQPLAGRWNLVETSPAVSMAASAALPAAPVRAIPAGETHRSIPVAPAVERAATPAPFRSWARPSLPALALGGWALGALLLLAAFGRSYLRLGRRLRTRPRVVGGDLHRQLQALAAEAGLGTPVRLTCSSRMPVPVALGLREPEICVPPRALAGLTEEQQEGMLAHELAHLARRDPFWLVLGQAIACVLFFQPLNWVARRRLREISEMLSDEWAVERTGRPLSLAGCLAEVAGWSVGVRPLPVPGMADRPSSLGRRIRRLLDETRSPESPARRAWLAAGMGVLVIAVAAAAPAVSTTRSEEPAKKARHAAATYTAAPVDVKDATDTPSHPEAAEMEARHEARHHDHDEAVEDGDDEDSPDVDVEVDTDEINEHVNASIEAALAGLDSQLENLSADHEMTPEEHERLSREIERSTRDIERDLKPRMEKLSRELSEKMAHQVPTAEMQRLSAEMARLAEQMAPSHEEMARLQAEIDREMQGVRADAKLTAEERERIQERAREMRREAEKMKPTAEQRRQMEQLRKQLAEEQARMGDQFRAENRDEIERVQREVRQEVDRELRDAREEMRRSLDERRAIEKQERKDRHERKDHHQRDAKPDCDHDDCGR